MLPQHVEIATSLSLDNAVERLSDEVAQGRRIRGVRPRLVGEVSTRAVTLYRHRSLGRNVAYAQFVGKFATVDGRTVLHGTFEEPGYTRFAKRVAYAFLGAFAMWLLVDALLERAGRRAMLGVAMIGVFGPLLWWMDSRIWAVNARTEAEFIVADLKRILE